MFKKLLCICCSSVATLATAETIVYQGEFTGTYNRYEDSWGSNGDTATFKSTDKSLGIKATYFLTPVETADIVQRELAFVRRSNAISLEFDHYESEAGIERNGYRVDLEDGDAHSGIVAGRYFVSDDIYVSGSYGKMFGGDDGAVRLGGGYYYGKTSALMATLARSVDEDDTAFSLGNRSLVGLGAGPSSLSYNVGLNGGFDNFEDTASITAGTHYYFTNHTGLGVSGGYHIDSEETSYTLSGSHFFNDILGFEVWLTDPDEGLDVFGATLVGRF